jgi:hypothetical protein
MRIEWERDGDIKSPLQETKLERDGDIKSPLQETRLVVGCCV